MNTSVIIMNTAQKGEGALMWKLQLIFDAIMQNSEPLQKTIFTHPSINNTNGNKTFKKITL